MVDYKLIMEVCVKMDVVNSEVCVTTNKVDYGFFTPEEAYSFVRGSVFKHWKTMYSLRFDMSMDDASNEIFLVFMRRNVFFKYVPETCTKRYYINFIVKRALIDLVKCQNRVHYDGREENASSLQRKTAQRRTQYIEVSINETDEDGVELLEKVANAQKHNSTGYSDIGVESARLLDIEIRKNLPKEEYLEYICDTDSFLKNKKTSRGALYGTNGIGRCALSHEAIYDLVLLGYSITEISQMFSNVNTLKNISTARIGSLVNSVRSVVSVVVEKKRSIRVNSIS